MRLRNFCCFDLFSSFHMRVNCWFLKSSTIDGTASRSGEKLGRRARRPTRFVRTLRTEVARGPSLISLFSGLSASVRKGDDHLVADHFDPIHVQRELRGCILRLPGLKIPRAIAVLADNRDPLPVHMAVGQHCPLVCARLVHAIETVPEAYDHDVVPHDLEVPQSSIGDLLDLA